MIARFAKTVIVSAFLLALVSLAVTGYDRSAVEKVVSDSALYAQIENFGEAISILRAEYVEPVDSTKLMHGAMKGMLSSLDEYSQFLEKNEYEELESDSKGEFGGIGIEISMKDGMLTVITPMDGSPAEAAGVRSGDRIIKIDNKATERITITDATQKMRGPPGTMVTLTLWRENGDRVFDVFLRRAMIKLDSIKRCELLEGGVGYIKMVEFQDNTARDLDAALKKLEEQGMASLILDLRNNPGGLLETAFDVAERFLKKGDVIVSMKSRIPEENAVFRSSGEFTRAAHPMVVLVNGGSASASEVVAGAIQDNKRGTVLGTKTFGKASVQTVVPLRDGSALRFTSSYYYTPSGKLIKKEGITPDVIVEGNGEDEQLKAAVKFLRGPVGA